MLCPRCGKESAPDANFCRNCGADLRAAVPKESSRPTAVPESAPSEAAPPPPTPRAEAPICRTCGATLKPGKRFCTNCGTPVVSPPAEEEPAAPAVSPPEPPVAVREPAAPPVAEYDEAPAPPLDEVVPPAPPPSGMTFVFDVSGSGADSTLD
jgi:hypothetical protein